MLVMTLFYLFLLQGGCFKLSEGSAFGNERAINESARDIPVVYDVDVVVVGGTSGGVAAAVEAAKKGATVFLAAQRPYLGEDICGAYRLGQNSSLRELILARALYHCGDYEGLGEKILREYARDLRAHYRRHAQTVLGRKTPRETRG